jgi:hypothetical protein
MSYTQDNRSGGRSSGMDNPSSTHLRLVVAQDQLEKTAEKVRLLASMGLTHTQGYADAVALYEQKRAAVSAMRASLEL